MLTSRCSICRHPSADGITLKLSKGEAVKALAQEYGVSPFALRRHSKHIPQEMLEKLKDAAKRAEDFARLRNLRTEESELMVARIVQERRDLNRLAGLLEANGDLRGANGCKRSLIMLADLECRVLELIGRHESKVVNNTQSIVISPDYLLVRQALSTALGCYPEAKAAVLKALRAIEAPAEQPSLPSPMESMDAERVETVLETT
jgi:hypothetical protein